MPEVISLLVVPLALSVLPVASGSCVPSVWGLWPDLVLGRLVGLRADWGLTRASLCPEACLCLLAADTQISAASSAPLHSSTSQTQPSTSPSLGLVLGFQLRHVLHGLLLLSDLETGGLIYICLRGSVGPTHLVPMATCLMPPNKNRSLRRRWSCVQEGLGASPSIALHLLCDLGQVTGPFWALVSSSVCWELSPGPRSSSFVSCNVPVSLPCALSGVGGCVSLRVGPTPAAGRWGPSTSGSSPSSGGWDSGP